MLEKYCSVGIRVFFFCPFFKRSVFSSVTFLAWINLNFLIKGSENKLSTDLDKFL